VQKPFTNLGSCTKHPQLIVLVLVQKTFQIGYTRNWQQLSADLVELNSQFCNSKKLNQQPIPNWEGKQFLINWNKIRDQQLP
jgi:hypothetical protein